MLGYVTKWALTQGILIVEFPAEKWLSQDGYVYAQVGSNPYNRHVFRRELEIFASLGEAEARVVVIKEQKRKSLVRSIAALDKPVKVVDKRPEPEPAS